MKFSEENLKAVEDRFVEYENSIGSGGHVALPQCDVCESALDIMGNRDCNKCVLSEMKLNIYTPNPISASCLTEARHYAVNRKTWETPKEGGLYKKHSAVNLRIRLKEMRDHVEKRLKDEGR